MNKHFLLLFFGAGLFLSTPTDGQEGPIATTQQYEFYSNYWINLHHFLYRTARLAANRVPLPGKERALVRQLTPDERAVFDECIQHYQEQLIERHIRRDDKMYAIKRALITYVMADELTGGNEEAIDDTLAERLNRFSPIYKSLFWPVHEAQNQKVLQENIRWVRELEKTAFPRLAQLTQDSWRDGKIRVDVSYFSNWAGAYTTNWEETHVVLASRDTGQPAGDWLELVFHESAHAILGSRGGPVNEAIAKAAEKAGKEVPQHLWHGILFYFTGKITQGFLTRQGIGYELYMLRETPFLEFFPAMDRHLPAYMAGHVSLQEAMEGILEEM